MHIYKVAPALRERLGHDATIGLLELVEADHTQRDDRVLSVAVDRFERRLAHELGDLRVALVREIHDARSDTIKWSFIFWVGQLAAIAGLLAFVLKLIGR